MNFIARGSRLAAVMPNNLFLTPRYQRMASSTPNSLVRSHLQQMLEHLPGVFNGDIESVHQARVATRRLREVLPLISVTRRETSSAFDIVRSAGRELGLVRELDVMDGVLEGAVDRSPRAAWSWLWRGESSPRRSMTPRHGQGARAARPCLLKSLVVPGRGFPHGGTRQPVAPGRRRSSEPRARAADIPRRDPRDRVISRTVPIAPACREEVRLRWRWRRNCALDPPDL